MERNEINAFLGELLEAEGNPGKATENTGSASTSVTEPVNATSAQQNVSVVQTTVNGKISKTQVAKTLTTLNKLRNGLRKAVYGRDSVGNTLVFALACNQHMLILGPHGEAKSLLVEKAIDFTKLKGYYTQVHVETSVKDIVGMINPAQALKGNLELVKTPFWEANILYFDEFLRARTEFLDFLLEVLEERTCSKTVIGNQSLPVVSVIATSNPLTDDYNTDDRLDLALKDRFAFIVDMGDHLIASSPAQVERILNTHNEDLSFNGNLRLDPNELRAFNQYAKDNVHVDVPVVRELFDILRKDKHKFSTRFIKRYKECVQVWALLNKRDTASDKDFLEVANLMLVNRFTSLNEPGIRKAVNEALSVKEFDSLVKEYNALTKKKGLAYIKEYLAISERLKSKSEASLPDRIRSKRTNAEKRFSVEFKSSWNELIKDPDILSKMNTPAFEDHLEDLSEFCVFRTKMLDKKQSTKFRATIKKLDPKGLLDVKSRESIDLDKSGKEIPKERFTIYPKINKSDSFKLCRTISPKLKEYLLKY